MSTKALAPAQILPLLKQTDIFQHVGAAALAELAGVCSIRNVFARQMLFLEGEPAEAGFILIDGRMALVKTSPSGKSLIIELLSAGETFAFPVVLNGRPYPVTARAQTDSSVLSLPKHALEKLSKQVPEFMPRVMQLLIDRNAASQQLARALAHDRVEVRIAAALLALIPRFGEGRADAPEIMLSRQELADITGTTLESASRAVHALKDDGIVDIPDQRSMKVLNRGELEQRARPA